MVNGQNQPTQKELAAALDMSQANVTKLKKQGMPVDSVESAQAWREARQNVAARKPAPASVTSFNPAPIVTRPQYVAPMPPAPEYKELPDEDHQMARTRREIAEANLAEMREAEERGDLIRVAAVKSTLATSFATARDALLQIPARMAPLLAADSDPVNVHNTLHSEIHQALQHLAGASDRIGESEGAIE